MGVFAAVPWRALLRLGPSILQYAASAKEVIAAKDETPLLKAKIKVLETEVAVIMQSLRLIGAIAALSLLVSLAALGIGIYFLVR